MVQDSIIDNFSKFCLRYNDSANDTFIINPIFYTSLLFHNSEYANDFISDSTISRQVDKLSKRAYNKSSILQFKKIYFQFIPLADNNET